MNGGSGLFRSRELKFSEEMLIFIPLSLHPKYDIEKKQQQKNKPWSRWVQIMPRLIVFLSLDVLSW